MQPIKPIRVEEFVGRDLAAKIGGRSNNRAHPAPIALARRCRSGFHGLAHGAAFPSLVAISGHDIDYQFDAILEKSMEVDKTGL
jgi:hypothetical protein